jgi:hypothetical protein
MRADLLFFLAFSVIEFFLIGGFCFVLKDCRALPTYLPRILTSFDRVAHFSRVCVRAYTQIEIGLYFTVRRIQSIFLSTQI